MNFSGYKTIPKRSQCGKITFIYTHPRQTLREQELQRSKALSNAAFWSHRYRKERKKHHKKVRSLVRHPQHIIDYGPHDLIVPTGCYISFPWTLGDVEINLANPTTRDVMMYEHTLTWHSFVKQPYFTRLAYIFNVAERAFQRHSPCPQFGADQTFIGYAVIQTYIEDYFNLDSVGRLSCNALRARGFALDQLRRQSQRTVDTLHILSYVFRLVHLEFVDRIAGRSQTTIHFDFLKRELIKRGRPTTEEEFRAWQCLSFMVHLQEADPEWPTHYEASTYRGVPDLRNTGLLPGFQRIAHKLPVLTIDFIKRAQTVFQSSDHVLSCEEITALPRDPSSEFPSFWHAIDCYRVSNTKKPKFPQVIELAILVVAAEACSGYALTGIYDIAIYHLSCAVQNYKANDDSEERCQLWAWLVSINSCRKSSNALTVRGQQLLQNLWQRYPLTQDWNYVEAVMLQEFLWIPSMAKKLNRDWQHHRRNWTFDTTAISY